MSTRFLRIVMAMLASLTAGACAVVEAGPIDAGAIQPTRREVSEVVANVDSGFRHYSVTCSASAVHELESDECERATARLERSLRDAAYVSLRYCDLGRQFFTARTFGAVGNALYSAEQSNQDSWRGRWSLRIWFAPTAACLGSNSIVEAFSPDGETGFDFYYDFLGPSASLGLISVSGQGHLNSDSLNYPFATAMAWRMDWGDSPEELVLRVQSLVCFASMYAALGLENEDPRFLYSRGAGWASVFFRNLSATLMEVDGIPHQCGE